MARTLGAAYFDQSTLLPLSGHCRFNASQHESMDALALRSAGGAHDEYHRDFFVRFGGQWLSHDV